MFLRRGQPERAAGMGLRGTRRHCVCVRPAGSPCLLIPRFLRFSGFFLSEECLLSQDKWPGTPVRIYGDHLLCPLRSLSSVAQPKFLTLGVAHLGSIYDFDNVA